MVQIASRPRGAAPPAPPPPPPPITTVGPVTARGQLRAFIRESIGEASYVSLPDLTRQAIAYLQEQPLLLEQALSELFYTAIYREVQVVVGAGRGIRPLGVTTSTRVNDPSRPQKVNTRNWFDWFEHVGDRNIRLLEMTKVDLKAAIAERQQRVNVEIGTILFLTMVEQRLRKNNQKVGEVMKAEDLDTLHREVTQQP